MNKKPLSNDQLAVRLKAVLAEAYPDIEIRAEPWSDDPSRTALYFVTERFAPLYQMQRYHLLIHTIPEDFFDEHLQNTVWFELAPGETPDDLGYLKEEQVAEIADNVLSVLEAEGFFPALYESMCPMGSEEPHEVCKHDFSMAKSALLECGFKEDEFFDIFHVLMDRGGFCDCEILYNAAPEDD